MGMPNSTASSRVATASGSMLPPWPLTISSLRKPSASDRPHHAAQHRLEGGVVQGDGAAEGQVVLGQADPHRRQHRDRGIGRHRLAARRRTHGRSRLSVQTGRCGPCCSRLPIGSTTSASCAASAFSSGPVMRCHWISMPPLLAAMARGSAAMARGVNPGPSAPGRNPAPRRASDPRPSRRRPRNAPAGRIPAASATTTPPLALPSSLVTARPVTSTISLKTFTCCMAFWPVVASSTSSTECGAVGSSA